MRQAKMAVRPYTASQGDEKRVFHHPAKALFAR
jgi:hypothetical protein